MEVDGLLARMLLMATGAMSAYAGLGLLFHVLLMPSLNAGKTVSSGGG